MARFLGRRLAWLALTLFCVSAISFAMMKSVRGGPFDAERALPPAIERNIAAHYHLDWPLWKQFAHYLGPFNLGQDGPRWLGGSGERSFGGCLAGDLGPSFKYRDFTVNDVVAQSFPISAALGALALAWAVLLGLAAGVAAAVWRGGALDLGLRLFATAGAAVPSFAIATLLVLLFSFLVPLLPVGGWGSPRHMVLPALALGAPCAAYVARLTRTGMLETLGADWVRTARAKGLSETRVVVHHALRGALLPVVSYLGPAAAGILTGSLVVERVFAIPGLGSHFVNAALNRDYTLAMGVTLLYTALVFSLNALVDLAYTLLDPRIPLEEA